MRKNEECKIVKDLLPNYIEKLTDPITNKFIESHIENCMDCEQVLKDMEGDIPLQKIKNNREINALKKVKRRNRFIILIMFLIITFSFILALYFLRNYSIIKNENGKLEIIKDTQNYKSLNYTHIILKGYIDEELEADITWIATINEENICINIREISQEYSSEFAEEEYNKIKNMNMSIATNAKLQGSRIYQNINLYNGKNKDELIDKFQKIYKNTTIIYI